MIPNLIHPVRVKVKRLVRDELVMDLDAREPYHGRRTTTSSEVTIDAQIKWRARDDLVPQMAGVVERSIGYILVRLIDMDAAMGTGVRFKRGDQIVEMGVLSGLDLYIVREEPIAHWHDQGGTTLIKYHFEDRAPVQQVVEIYSG